MMTFYEQSIPDVSRKRCQPESSQIRDSPLQNTRTFIIVYIEARQEGNADAGDTNHKNIIYNAPEK